MLLSAVCKHAIAGESGPPAEGEMCSMPALCGARCQRHAGCHSWVDAVSAVPLCVLGATTISLLCCLQVGRNNFRPPPKVDSSVVRIEPRNPLPNVNFKEWDGLGRLCFSRKNKTLGAIFRQKSVVQLVEKNMKTFQALKDAGVVMQGAGDVMMMAEVAEENEEMDLDGTAAVDSAAESMEVEGSGEKGKEASVYKEKALQVLRSGGFEDKRSSKLTQDDFLRLLSLFNEAGIHFA